MQPAADARQAIAMSAATFGSESRWNRRGKIMIHNMRHWFSAHRAALLAVPLTLAVGCGGKGVVLLESYSPDSAFVAGTMSVQAVALLGMFESLLLSVGREVHSSPTMTR